jgi:hypothetical protein
MEPLVGFTPTSKVYKTITSLSMFKGQKFGGDQGLDGDRHHISFLDFYEKSFCATICSLIAAKREVIALAAVVLVVAKVPKSSILNTLD